LYFLLFRRDVIKYASYAVNFGSVVQSAVAINRISRVWCANTRESERREGSVRDIGHNHGR